MSEPNFAVYIICFSLLSSCSLICSVHQVHSEVFLKTLTFHQIGTKVVQVTARDLDDGAYGSVDYSLEGDSEATRLFKIHPTTGTITVAQALPDTDYQVVSLVVVATDGGMSELYLSTFVSHL